MTCWIGKLNNRTVLIAATSKRRAGELLGSVDGLKEVPYPSWAKPETVYVMNESGDYEERR
jgi:hypothetical protein